MFFYVLLIYIYIYIYIFRATIIMVNKDVYNINILFITT